MPKYFSITCLWLLGAACTASAQRLDSVGVKKSHFVFYLGAGQAHYLGNIVIFESHLDPWNYAICTRIMWEPEQMISLGIESGYAQLYTASFTGIMDRHTLITKSIIPIQFVASIKFLRECYANLSMGQASVRTHVQTSGNGTTNSSTWSLADFGIATGWRHYLSKRFLFGVEAKSFYSTKSNDGTIMLMAMAGYSF